MSDMLATYTTAPVNTAAAWTKLYAEGDLPEATRPTEWDEANDEIEALWASGDLCWVDDLMVVR